MVPQKLCISDESLMMVKEVKKKGFKRNAKNVGSVKRYRNRKWSPIIRINQKLKSHILPLCTTQNYDQAISPLHSVYKTDIWHC